MAVRYSLPEDVAKDGLAGGDRVANRDKRRRVHPGADPAASSSIGRREEVTTGQQPQNDSPERSATPATHDRGRRLPGSAPAGLEPAAHLATGERSHERISIGFVEHRGDPERVDRAHRVCLAFARKRDAMRGRATGER